MDCIHSFPFESSWRNVINLQNEGMGDLEKEKSILLSNEFMAFIHDPKTVLTKESIRELVLMVINE